MSIAAARQLLDFSAKLDVNLLDQVKIMIKIIL